jgi:hypothetical protein
MEGIVFTVVDVFVLTITMKHGTSYDASVSISKPGQWRIWGGKALWLSNVFKRRHK